MTPYSKQDNHPYRTTIIIPNWNGLEELKECLTSIREYAPGAPLIIVDNGSGDGSRDYLRSDGFRKEYPGARVFLLPKNTGFCHAVNLGARKAATKYVFMLNNDARLLPGCLEALEAGMEEKPHAFSLQALILDKEGEKIDSAGDLYCALGYSWSLGRGKPVDTWRKEAPLERDLEIFSACAGAAIYSRELFLSLGGMDEAHFAYLEDVDLGYRARLLGLKSFLCPEARVLHQGSASTGSRHNPFKVFYSARNNFYLNAKNMPLLQLMLNAPGIAAGCLVKQVYFGTKGLGGYYAAGLVRGIGMSLGREGRKRHIPYRSERLPQYIAIQLNLWHNILALLRTIM